MLPCQDLSERSIPGCERDFDATFLQFGTRRTRSTQRLQWDNLVSDFGSDEAIAERVAHVRRILEAEEPDLLALIDKYIESWRPDDWD